MKRILCLICALTFLFCLFGCTKESSDYKKPVKVYYCSHPISYNSPDAVISGETREYHDWNGDLLAFLNHYLTGPISSGLISPFPLGGTIMTLETHDTAANVHLNVHFSRLKPNELTLACACMSMTLFDVANVDTVNFRIIGAGNEITEITMTQENLLLMDTGEIN